MKWGVRTIREHWQVTVRSYRDSCTAEGYAQLIWEWLFERWERRAEWKRSEILLTNGLLTSLTDTIDVFLYQLKNSFSFHHSLMRYFSFSSFSLYILIHSVLIMLFIVKNEENEETGDQPEVNDRMEWMDEITGLKWGRRDHPLYSMSDTREKKRVLLYSCATRPFILSSRSVLCGCG